MRCKGCRLYDEAAEGACPECKPEREDERFGVRGKLRRPNPENQEERRDCNDSSQNSLEKSFRGRQVKAIGEGKIDAESSAKTGTENQILAEREKKKKGKDKA
jgi:hypothetical protein